jgi:hypothetical protein
VPGDLVAVRTALQDAGIDYESAEAGFQPSVSVPVDVDGARKVFKLVDALGPGGQNLSLEATNDQSASRTGSCSTTTPIAS